MAKLYVVSLSDAAAEPCSETGTAMSSDTSPDQPTTYRVRIKGHLGPEWTDWFGGLAITLEDNGDTLLTGLVVDQAALHGLLRRVRDLGMPLVSVSPMKGGEES